MNIDRMINNKIYLLKNSMDMEVCKKCKDFNKVYEIKLEELEDMFNSNVNKDDLVVINSKLDDIINSCYFSDMKEYY